MQAPRTAYLVDKGSQLFVRVVVIDAYPTLDSYRRFFARPIPHRQAQVLHMRGRSHQCRPKGPLASHFLARATAVEVDGVVVVRSGEAAGFSYVGSV